MFGSGLPATGRMLQNFAPAKLLYWHFIALYAATIQANLHNVLCTLQSKRNVHPTLFVVHCSS